RPRRTRLRPPTHPRHPVLPPLVGVRRRRTRPAVHPEGPPRMSQPTPRPPHDHALWPINNVEENITGMVTQPNGQPRSVDGPTAVGILTARSHLAIASALAAIAEALRGEPR